MSTDEMTRRYLAPQSIEQVLRIPQEVYEPSDFKYRPYGCRVFLDPKLSHLDRLMQFENDSYNEDRKRITQGMSEDSLTCLQISQLEQLDTVHRNFSVFCKTQQHFQNTPHSLQLPLTSEDAKEVLASIRAAFGFTTKDLAEVLRVERQTIYAWFRGENAPSSENSHRIRSLDELGKKWNELCNLPAKKYLRVNLDGKTTLLSELRQEKLDFDRLFNMMDLVANLVNEREIQSDNEKNLQGSSNRVSEYDMITLNAFLPKGE